MALEGVPLAIVLLSLALTLIYGSHVRARLKIYEDNDLSKIEGWELRKTEALKSGLEKGHNLERLSEELHQSTASIRAKLVNMKLYDRYHEVQLSSGEQHFRDWLKLKKKLDVNYDAHESLQYDQLSVAPSWRFLKELINGRNDARVEFCGTFFTFSNSGGEESSQSKNSATQHVAAFLNSAGGEVLIGVESSGKISGVLDDNFLSASNYKSRVHAHLKSALSKKALPFISIYMIRWGSEDLCLIRCRKSDERIICRHMQYNDLDGTEEELGILYLRLDGQTSEAANATAISRH
jgi:hypothetical protein